MKKHNFYIDSNRHLVGDAVLGVQGEHRSDVIVIKCPKKWGECDLTQADITLQFHAGDYFEQLHPKTVEYNDEITLYFPITRNLTARAGEVVLGVIAQIKNECVFKSHTLSCVVKAGAVSPEDITAPYPEELTQLHNLIEKKADKAECEEINKQTNLALSLLEESKADKKLVSEEMQSLGEELSESISKMGGQKMDKLSSHVGNLAGLKDGNACDSGFSLNALDGGFFELSHLGETVQIFERKPLDIANWNDVQTIVRAGLANRYFKVGDTLRCKKGEKTLEWTVIGIDEDTPSDSRYTHALTLMSKNAVNTFQMDATQAVFYCDKNYPVGNYHFTLGGKIYAFTAIDIMLQGSQLFLNWDRNLMNVYHHEYATQVYLQPLVATVEMVPENSTELTPTNVSEYTLGGCNKYLISPLKKWLNSEGESWWTPASIYSRRHYKINEKGFLYDVEREFLNVIGAVKKQTHEEGENKITDERFFILSAMESGVSTMYGEGKPYSYLDSDEKRIKTFNGTPVRWWLRTPIVVDKNYNWTVNTNGKLNHNMCSSEIGVCAVCCVV